MDQYAKAALIVRLKLETATLNYARTLADIDRLEAQDARDPAVQDALIYAYAYRDKYESVWSLRYGPRPMGDVVARSASEASA